MADIAPGEVVRVSTRFKMAAAGDIMNVWRWKNDSALAVADADLIAAVKAKMSTAFALISTDLHQDVDPYDIRFDVVDYVGGVEVVTRAIVTDSWVLSTPPASAVDSLPPMDAALINFRTSQPGSFGRKYIGGIVEGVNAAGILQSNTLGRLASFATEMLTAVNAGGAQFKLGTFSQKAGFVGNWVGFSAAVINSVIASQRRRRKNTGT